MVSPLLSHSYTPGVNADFTMGDNVLIHFVGIGGLFDFDVDGDVGVDPNYMTLWFSQPGLGLPSKVRTTPSPELRFDALVF